MIDLMSVVIGIVVGVSVGFIIGTVRSVMVVDQLKSENDHLSDKLRKLTDRDERGRFKGGK